MELTNNIVNLDQIVLKKNTRIDKTGQIITKGKKNHKVTFIDEIEKEKQLHTVQIVECWKKYNYVSNEPEVADDCCQLI